MNIKTHIYWSLVAFIVLLFGSCTNEQAFEETDANVKHTIPLVVSAKIAGSSAAVTRADDSHFSRWPWEDYWSYYKFDIGDTMGFFSQHGNESVNEGQGALENVPLVYDVINGVGIFTSLDGTNISPSLLTGSTTYVYFPYDANVQSPGLELRRLDSDNVLKCVDCLTTDGLDLEGLEKDGMMYATFYHTFSELIIIRGEGFNNLKEGVDPSIKVVMKDSYTHLKITPTDDGTSWQCKITLENNPTNTKNKADDYRVWDTWVGENYGKTTEDPEGRPASYVILPTIGSGNERATVDYIELYDNNGVKQTVSALKLSNDKKKETDPDNFTKKLTPGWRYPFEISMQELVPTVNPFPIVPWEENKDITDKRTCGIHSPSEFDDWINTYNTYLAGNTTEEQIEKLLQYGNRVVEVDSDGKETFLYWHFYLMTDLDEWTETSGAACVIPELCDVLDGLSSTLSNSVFQNHTLKNLKTPLIGKLTGEYASVQNITFSKPEIHLPDRTSPVGVVVQTIENGGTVENCNVINGSIYAPSAAVGMVAGTVSGAGSKITGCNLSGMLIGRSSADNIAGENNGGTIENNNSASVVFNQQP